jgi:CheY-like chemotaxis protein/two-component sensor histidine kinase
MVLDYSKINAFERDQLANPTLSLDDVHSKSTKAVQTKLSTHGAIDLAILTEEVIEGVATGHAFDGPQYRAARHESWDCNISGKLPEEVTILIPRRPNVELIIDISNQDWICWCEPGSIRRIVMNLVGNALKYTNAGFVHVKLEKQIAQAEGIEYGILTVSDSGQGISPAYLKDKLYKPFAQESNQAPGVGLGLSLVKSIVTTIEGQIHIESTVDVGTKATVRFPLTRTPPSGSIPQDLASRSSLPRLNLGLNDDRVAKTMIDVQERGKIIALYQQEEVEATNDQQEAWRLLRQSLTAYLSSWAGKPVIQWECSCTPDIVVVEESALEALLKLSPWLSAQECQTQVLVLRSTASKNVATGKNIEDVRHPIGPHKLARALQACLSRCRADSMRETEVSRSSAQLDAVTTATANLNMSATSATEDKGLTTNRSAIAHVASPSKNPEDAIAATLLDGSSESKATVGSNNTTPTHSVLVVDDNTINLRLLQVGMKKRGYASISSASDGLQAVNTYRTLLQSSPPVPPGIILMDLSMPIMNGFEATRQIREIEAEHNSSLAPSQTPQHSLIIALTGLASVRDQKEAYTAGVDSYIMKPVSFAKLTTLLEKWTVDGKSAEAENGNYGSATAA